MNAQYTNQDRLESDIKYVQSTEYLSDYTFPVAKCF